MLAPPLMKRCVAIRVNGLASLGSRARSRVPPGRAAPRVGGSEYGLDEGRPRALRTPAAPGPPARSEFPKSFAKGGTRHGHR